ncbi:MAG: hypothetical protein ACE5I7_14865 [Candidatus Binatia bacterium]
MHLWRREEDEWQQFPVTEQIGLLEDSQGRVTADRSAAHSRATIVAFTENGTQRAALITTPGAGVMLNGYVPLGVAVLEDRDEITVRGAMLYFAAHSPTEVMAFPAADTETRCARCKRPLRPGDVAVRCAACSAWHHEGDLAGAAGTRRLCWTYEPTCGGCGREREAMIWRPEEEEDDD